MKRRWRRILLVVLVLAGAGGYLALRQVKKHRLPDAVWQCLRHPLRVTVYALHPRPAQMEVFIRGAPDPAAALAQMDLFQGYRVLGQTELTADADRRRACDAVASSAASVFAVPQLCFDPRHGVRVTDGRATFDFVICYGCRQMLCRDGDKTVANTEAGGSSAALDAFLLAAHVSTEKASEEN